MEIRISELESLLIGKLLGKGFARAEAKIITAEFIGGDLAGKTTHGVFSFPRFYRRISTTSRGHFRVSKDRGPIAYFDGRGDAGQLLAARAVDMIVRKAKRYGVAAVGGGNHVFFQRPAAWAEKMAEREIIGLCFIYGGGPIIAPTGSAEPILSTNPIGIAIPTAKEPIVLDMAVSEKAYSNVDVAKALGKKLAGDWALDRAGRPTRDPHQAVSIRPIAGYKGFGLALMLEILTGALMQTPAGKRGKGPRGFLFIGIDPRAFTTVAAFRRETAKLVREVKGARRLPGVSSIRLPGERASALRKEILKRGTIEIDPRTLDAIRKL